MLSLNKTVKAVTLVSSVGNNPFSKPPDLKVVGTFMSLVLPD